jgi:hypothetical protein
MKPVRFAVTAIFAALGAGYQAPRPAAAALPRFVMWTDPTERAFTVQVPSGWQVRGGTHRNSPIDARNFVAVQEPGKKIVAWVDDPNILPRQVPHPAYYRLGYYEGRVVQSPAGPLQIERFRTGAQFAEEFVQTKICRAPETLALFDLRRETQQMSQDIAPVAARARVRASASAGEYVFHCGDRYGYVYAVTVLAWTTAQGPQNWAVYKLAGYLSDKSQVDMARYVMNKMRASFAIDPGWQQRYDAQVHDTTGALIEMSNRITGASIRAAQESLQWEMQMVERRQHQFDQMTKASMDSFKRQQDSNDRIRQRWSDITLGQVHGCDDLGNCATVSNDYDHYWTKGGKVVGGPSDGSPPQNDPSYREWHPDY